MFTYPITGASVSAAKTGLLHWWDLTEASGTRADSHGSLDFTDSGAGGTRTGPGGVGVAANFDGSPDRFYTANPSGLTLTDLTSISICGWFIFDVSFIPHYPIHNGTDYNTAAQLNYSIQRSSTTINWRLGATPTGLESVSPGTVANATWVFIYAYYNGVTKDFGASLNDGTVTSATSVNTRTDVSSNLYTFFAQPSYYGNGGSASIGIYDQQLDAATVTSLYNGGTRLLYADL